MKNTIITKLETIGDIRGVFYSKSKKKSKSLILYAKGAPTLPDDGELEDSEIILDFDIDIFVPDYLGYGRSNGIFTPQNCIKTFISLNSHFKNYYQNIYFVGFSFGGAIVSLLPKFNKEINNLCLISPILDYGAQGSKSGEETIDDFFRTMEHAGYKHLYRGIAKKVWRDHFSNKDKLYPKHNIKHLSDKKVFLSHGRKDSVIHYAKTVSFYNSLHTAFPENENNFRLNIYDHGHDKKTRLLALHDYAVFAGIKRVYRKNALRVQKEKMLMTYADRNIAFVRGEEIYLVTKTNEKYFDMLTSYGVNILGYGNKRVERYIARQLKLLPTLHNSMSTDIRSQALEKLFKYLPKDSSKVYLSNSGSESVEAALKFALAFTGRKKILAAKNSYHGGTFAAMSVTGISHGENIDRYRESMLDCSFFEFGNLNDLSSLLGEDVACVILEPIQGQGGIVIPERGYLKEVKKLCEKYGVLLIIDEVQTGLGRTGSFLYIDQHDVSPHILCLGKGIGGGIPLGLTIVNQAVANKLGSFYHCTTMGGNPLAMAGMLGVLEELEKNQIMQNAKKVGKYFREKLSKLNFIEDVRGEGLMIGFAFKGMDGIKAGRLLQRNKIVYGLSGDDKSIRFLPALTLTEKDVDNVITHLAIAGKQIYNLHKNYSVIMNSI